MSAPEGEPQTRTFKRFIAPGQRVRKPVIKGQDSTRWTDSYHAILIVPWSVFLLGLALYFALMNAGFAVLYMADPHGIDNAKGFWDYFLFSVQTMGSANYTVMMPRSVYANIIVSSE